MKISKDTLRGYILEEVLAYLIRNTGYRLLVDASQDTQELDSRPNGLVVRGRGAVHQVDVLGELTWIPAFTYPLRLFVEAKFRNARTGIPEVRNLVATLLDVNQNNFPQPVRASGGTPQLRPKYYYTGAIFSTSGFSGPAMDMALAHNVSLIDLGTPEFATLLDAINRAADGIMRTFASEETTAVAAEDDTEGTAQPSEQHLPRGRFVLALRSALRSRLETLTARMRDDLYGLSADIEPTLNPAVLAALEMRELFVGMGRGPYMLVMKADDPEAFLRFAKEQPAHRVRISWSLARDDARTWHIVPSQSSPAYRLSFRLPRPIYEWIFSSENVRRAALDAKQQFFSTIHIYRREPNRDLLVRLEFDPREID